MEDTSIIVNLGDPKAKEIAEVIGNKTANKILDCLSKKDLTVSEISRDLKMPLNTVDYNIKKLLKAGLIEKADSWWSVKGRRMPTYKVSNRKIIISPRNHIVSSLLIVLGLVGLAAFFISMNFGDSYYSSDLEGEFSEASLKSLQGNYPTAESDLASLEVGFDEEARARTTAVTAPLEDDGALESSKCMGGPEGARCGNSVDEVQASPDRFVENERIEPWVWFLIGAFVVAVLLHLVNLINRRRLRR